MPFTRSRLVGTRLLTLPNQARLWLISGAGWAVYRKHTHSIGLPWYNFCVCRLDTIGIAGFSHDFRSLHGERSEVYTAFESFTNGQMSMFDIVTILLDNFIPMIDQLPRPRKKSRENLSNSLRDIAVKLLVDSEKIGDQKHEDKSIIGLLRLLSIHLLCWSFTDRLRWLVSQRHRSQWEIPVIRWRGYVPG